MIQCDRVLLGWGGLYGVALTARNVTPDLDPLVTAVIATPGTVQVNEPAQFSGQLIAGRLALTGGVTVHCQFEPAPL